MYISKRNRIYIKNKYKGKCAYSGTKLENDWQIDHIKPVIRDIITGKPIFIENDTIENMVPVQKIINHYKGGLDLESFRNWFLAGLHERLKKLPKNPKTQKSKNKKEYLLKVASYFKITENKPFSGKFFFEQNIITVIH
jgi:hypothetical protein